MCVRTVAVIAEGLVGGVRRREDTDRAELGWACSDDVVGRRLPRMERSRRALEGTEVAGAVVVGGSASHSDDSKGERWTATEEANGMAVGRMAWAVAWFVSSRRRKLTEG